MSWHWSHKLTPVRLTLALVFSLSLIHLTHSLTARYNAATARWFVVLTLVQFHIPYYAGRTLPNFTALPLCELR